MTARRRRRGMISMVCAFVLLTLLLFLAVLLNAGVQTGVKLDDQNAADAIANGAGVQQARAMNTLTALNHLIGELNALSVLAGTPGGAELESGQDFDLAAEIQEPLESAYADALAAGAKAGA